MRLGTGCDIELVEYTGTLVKTDDAKVGEAKKQQAAPVGPEEGLSAMEAAIEITSLSKSYKRVSVLKDVSLSVAERDGLRAARQ